MARKNRRPEGYTPLDLTPNDVRRTGASDAGLTAYQIRERARQREAEQAERQKQARMAQGIDWSVCLVPGCGAALLPFGRGLHADKRRRDPDIELPLCYRHCGVLWRQLARLHADDALFIDAIADVNARVAEREQRLRAEDRETFMARTNGQIYFVRVGELVKVGWTRDLDQRLKSYGASAELLVCYPGTRDDETNLHRQLRPALAKGREWYHDGAIIARYIDEALAQYGVPPTRDLWTQPKPVVAGKRAMRYR